MHYSLYQRNPQKSVSTVPPGEPVEQDTMNKTFKTPRVMTRSTMVANGLAPILHIEVLRTPRKPAI